MWQWWSLFTSPLTSHSSPVSSSTPQQAGRHQLCGPHATHWVTRTLPHKLRAYHTPVKLWGGLPSVPWGFVWHSSITSYKPLWWLRQTLVNVYCRSVLVIEYGMTVVVVHAYSLYFTSRKFFGVNVQFVACFTNQYTEYLFLGKKRRLSFGDFFRQKLLKIKPNLT